MRGLAALAALASLAGAASAGAGASAPARFTVTRTLADGRTVTQALTLEELQAMVAPRAPNPPPHPTVAVRPAPAARASSDSPPHTVVFKLPPPVPDASGEVAASAPAAVAAPLFTVSRLALNGRWVALSRDDLLALTRAHGDAGDPASVSPLVVEGRPAKAKKASAPLGVRNGAGYGDQGRFYLYAGVKNRGVGLNLTDHNGTAPGGWAPDGMTYDKGGFAGQRSVGVGWRQGEVSTSLGWVHEKTRVHLFGAPSEKDDRLALTLSWRPSVK